MSDLYFQDKYRIPSARRPNWDYATSGFYFVTINTDNRNPYFGKIESGKMILSDVGKIADEQWRNIPEHFPHVTVDEYIIMPDHVHGLLLLDDATHHTSRDATLPTSRDAMHDTGRDAINRVSTHTSDRVDIITTDRVNIITTDRVDPTDDRVEKHNDAHGGITGKNNPMLQPNSLSKILRWYKGRVTFEIRKQLSIFGWQSRFHDRIVRDEIALYHIREYIKNNPDKYRDAINRISTNHTSTYKESA